MEPPRPKLEPLWSKASQDSKASLDRFFATGKYSSGSDDETTAPTCSSLASTRKAAIICQSIRRRSLPSDEDTDTDEDLPDLAPRPCANLKLQITTSIKSPMHTNHKSKIADVVTKSQKTSSSEKWQDKEDRREFKYCASKAEAVIDKPLIKSITFSPFFVAEEIVQTSDHIETKSDLKWRAKPEASKNVPHPALCDWTNICRPSLPLSPARVRKKLFASPKRETFETSRPWSPFLKEEVVYSCNSENILSPNVSVSCDETGFGLNRCIKRKAADCTTGYLASSPDFQHLKCHSYARREADNRGKRKKDETCSSDTEDDDLPFARCAAHVADEELLTMWYRQFVKRRRQAVTSWKECNECQSLHSAYISPRSLPNLENQHSLQLTSDSKPTPALASKFVPTSDPAEVISVSDSDDDTMTIKISKRDSDVDTMILGTSILDEDSDSETLILETSPREDGSDDDTMIIEISSQDEDSNDSPQKPPINAAKGQRMIFDPVEVISISDDDTIEIDSSLECDVPTEAPNFVGVLTTPKKEPNTLINEDGVLDAFRLLKSPKTEPKATGQQEKKPRRSRGVMSSTSIRNYTPEKNNVITKYFQSSPKNEQNITANHSPCSKTAQRPGTTDVIPKHVQFQEPSRSVGSHSDFRMMEEDTDDEFEEKHRATRRKPRSHQTKQPVCNEVPNLNHGIEHLVYNYLEAKGTYLPLGLQLIYDCCNANVKPSHGLVAHLLTTWQGAEKAIEVQQCYSALTNLQRRYQVLGDHDLWCYLNKAASILETSSDLVQVEANSRLVDFLTRAMEKNLEPILAGCTKGTAATNHCTAKHSLVYKILNPMMESARIRAVSQWMTNCVIRNHSGNVAGCLSLFLRCLSQLLEMAIKNQRECSKSMANNFHSMYAQLTLWEHRRALVDLMQPALLQSIFLATLLEDRASRLRISNRRTKKYLTKRLSVKKITKYFFLMGPLSLDPCSEDFEEQLFLQFYLLKSHLEASEESGHSNGVRNLFEARKAFQNLEAQCYHDCPDLRRSIHFQQTLACLRLIFV